MSTRGVSGVTAKRTNVSNISGSKKKVCSSTFVLICFLITWHGVIQGADASVCSGCYNGGQLSLPNSIFGLCRCRCLSSFKGPRCEFVGKRSSEPALAGSSDIDVQSLSPSGSKVDILKDMWSRLKDRMSRPRDIPFARQVDSRMIKRGEPQDLWRK